MSQLLPVVRNMYLCEEVEIDEANSLRISIIGLLGNLRSLNEPPFPIVQEQICVYLQITSCRGPAQGRIEIRNADTDELVFVTQSHTMQFRNDPLEIQGVKFRIRGCLFQEPGLYWVQFWYNETMLAQQSFVWK